MCKKNIEIQTERGSEIIVLFPNGNSMIVTKYEIISLESDGTVTVTDSMGSNAVMPLDMNAYPCEEQTCSELRSKFR